MQRILKALAANIRRRPSAKRLGALSVTGLLSAAALAVAGSGLLAQFIGGLALIPLSFMAYLMLLPAWSDNHGSGGWPDDKPPDDPPPDEPDPNIDWTAFERQFWSHVEQQRMLPRA